METLRQTLLTVHLVAGFMALGLFWVPALARKGGLLHRRAGRWYTAAMAVITVTGFGLAALFLSGERWRTGLFLLFLGVITGTSLWNGWRVLQFKREPQAYAGRMHVAVAVANILGGGALVAFGIAVKAPLFYAFGPVGLLIGGAMLSFALRSSSDPLFWRAQHLTGMIGSGIASHVAFFAFGGNRLFGWGTEGYGLVLWLAPLVAGTVAIVVLNVRPPRAYAKP